jgi:hypothetical protein
MHRGPIFEGKDAGGPVLRAIAFSEIDGKPSLRYITPLRDGARQRAFLR